ncbi:MAG: ParA family protein [Acidimicrobiaceae bacterium]|nr:ParA family protein [Acidimicrobiaceae bacterium]
MTSMRVVSLYNIKGGVGKTTFAVNIAYESSRAGIRTLLWDLDPQGSSSYILRIKPHLKGDLSQVVSNKSSLGKSVKETQWPLLDVIPSDFDLRHLSALLEDQKRQSTKLSRSMKAFSRDYDLVVVDCAPEASTVSENVINFSDLIIVPVIPNPLSINTFEKLITFVREVGNKSPVIYAAFNMVDRRKYLHKQLLETYLNKDPRFLRNYIPASSSIEHMTSNRAPLETYIPRSLSTTAFTDLTEEILNLMSRSGSSGK